MTAFIDDRDDVLGAVDLPSLFAELVGPQARGGGWPCPNPQHAQSGASPPVSLDAARGLWKCHGCGGGGTAVDVLALACGLSVADAFAELRRRAGQEQRPAAMPRPRPAPPADPPLLPPAAAERVLAAFLDARGWHRDVADEAGLHAVADRRGRPRIRFPFQCGGEVRWHQDRATGSGEPKWLSPTGRAPIPYATTDLLAALDAAAECGSVVLVEGPADAVALAHAWIGQAVVALPGTGSTAVAKLAAAVAGLDVVTMFDADEAGDRLRAKLTPALTGAGCQVAHLRPPVADLDDWRRSCDCDDARFRAEVDAALDELEWEVPNGLA